MQFAQSYLNKSKKPHGHFSKMERQQSREEFSMFGIRSEQKSGVDNIVIFTMDQNGGFQGMSKEKERSVQELENGK